MKTLKQLFEHKESITIAIYEPTMSLVKKILYPRFEEIFSSAGFTYKLNRAEGVLDIPNVGQILFLSLENVGRIVGYEVHHSHVDELDTLDKDKAEEVWNKLSSRNRLEFKCNEPYEKGDERRAKNTISVYTTPEGFRFVYARWKKKEGVAPEIADEYQLIKASSYDNPFLPEDYIPNLEASYPKELIQAYLNGEFVNLQTGAVWTSFDMEKNHTDAVIGEYTPFNQPERLHIGCDFNVGHMSAVVGVSREGKLLILDEITDQKDTPSMIAEIKRRYGHHPVTMYPDASGTSRKTVDASKSDIGLLRDAGFAINAPKRNPPVRQRILDTNTGFCNSKGERKVLINTNKCPKLCANLLEQAYTEDGQPQKTNNVDHLPDSISYLVSRRLGVSRARGKAGTFRLAQYH